MASAMGFTPLTGDGCSFLILLIKSSALVSEPSPSKNWILLLVTLGLPAPEAAPETLTGYVTPPSNVPEPVIVSFVLG